MVAASFVASFVALEEHLKIFVIIKGCIDNRGVTMQGIQISKPACGDAEQEYLASIKMTIEFYAKSYEDYS